MKFIILKTHIRVQVNLGTLQEFSSVLSIYFKSNLLSNFIFQLNENYK